MHLHISGEGIVLNCIETLPAGLIGTHQLCLEGLNMFLGSYLKYLMCVSE